MDIFCKAARNGTAVSGAAKTVTFRYVNRALGFMLIGLRPLLGSTTCRYQESCSNYTNRMLQEKSLLPALWHSTKRILSCNPFFSPKTDL